MKIKIGWNVLKASLPYSLSKTNDHIMRIVFFLFFSILFPSRAIAWDGIVSGVIDRVDVAPLDGDNAGFKIRLVNNPPLCGNANAWGYVNKTDDNYQATVSLLLAAKMADKPITVYANQDEDTSYCHIGYITMN